MMTAQQRRYYNLRHKKHLNEYRAKIKENQKNLKVAIQKYHKADKILFKFRNAKKHGLIQIPKERKLKYKLMIHNSKSEYNTLLKYQHELKVNFNRVKYGHQPKKFNN